MKQIVTCQDKDDALDPSVCKQAHEEMSGEKGDHHEDGDEKEGGGGGLPPLWGSIPCSKKVEGVVCKDGKTMTEEIAGANMMEKLQAAGNNLSYKSGSDKYSNFVQNNQMIIFIQQN